MTEMTPNDSEISFDDFIWLLEDFKMTSYDS